MGANCAEGQALRKVLLIVVKTVPKSPLVSGSTCPGHDDKPPGKASDQSTGRTPRLSHTITRRRAKVHGPMLARRKRATPHKPVYVHGWPPKETEQSAEVADETKTA